MLKPTQINEILQAFAELIQPVSGDLNRSVSGPCSQETPKENAICFIAEEEFIEPLTKSSIGALVVHTKYASKVRAPAHIAVLSTKNPKLAMALVNQKFFRLPFKSTPFDGHNIHPSAVIAKTARVSPNAIVEPNATICEHVKISDGARIGANSYIGPYSAIGADTQIHALVSIGHHCSIGARCEIKSGAVIGGYGFGYARDEKGLHHRLPHYGGVIIEDDVHIGSNTTVDAGTFEPTHIGAGSKFDNLCHIGHNATIGKNVIATSGLVTAGSATIGDNCVFGGGVAVNGHITICSNCSFAPLTAVSCSIDKPGIYGGYPPIPFKDSLKVQTSIQHLPRLRRSMARVMKHLGLSEEAES